METNEKKNAQAGQYLTFVLKDQRYGIQIETVREINRLTSISPVPQVPDYVSGVMNLRGKVVPIVDLNMRFGFEPCVPSKETCVIVVESPTGQVGTIVDRVSGVSNFTAEEIEPAPQMGMDEHASFVTGIGKCESGVIILVDATGVLSMAEFASMKQLVGSIAA